MSHSLATLPHGTRLQNGAYAIGPVLGQGGFGITYKGGDLAQKRYVAIKEFFPPGAIRQGVAVVPTGSADFNRGKADFLHEAQTLARFDNPSIVGVSGAFEENNSTYMVMEFLEGQTLGERIKEKGALDEWEVIDIGVRLLGALGTIHNAGILHRDIKPDNVMLTRTGRAVLIDFGTARAFEGTAQSMTQIVTPGYAPLEQYASSAQYGPTTDIYALGATLYHALSGVMPVAATDRAADVPLPSLRTLVPSLPPIVADAVMGALEMDAARRPQSAQAFAAGLSGSPATPRVKPPPTHPAPVYSPNLISPPAFPPSQDQAPTPTLKLPLVSVVAPTLTPNPISNSSEDTSSFMAIHNTLERHTSVINALAFSPDGSRLVSAGADRMVNVWDWSRNALAIYFPAHDQGITALSYSPDGVWLASGGRDGRVYIWDAALPPIDSSKRAPVGILSDCRGEVLDIAFCPTRRELLVGDTGAVTLWDATSGSIKARLETSGASVAWAPDGQLLVVSGVQGNVLHLCNGEDLTPRGQLQVHQGEITDVAFSPDGTLLATTGNDGFLRLWNVAQGAMLWEHRATMMAASCVAWSPDGRLLASASRDTVFVWTLRGESWRHYKKHTGQIQALAFAPLAPPPYRYAVASAARDRTINVCRIKCDAVT